LVCASSLFLCTSCTTTKTEYITEYVPLEVDLSGIVEPVLAMRPDNTSLDIHTGPVLQLSDVVHNSLQYQSAWFSWQDYAELLEDVINEIQVEYGPSIEESASF